MTRIVGNSEEGRKDEIEQDGELSHQGDVEALNPEVIRTQADRVDSQDDRERFHFGLPQGKLRVWNADPAYHYHWINDTPGRVEMALASGYEFVTKGQVSLVPGVVSRDSEVGSKVSAVVGSQESGESLRAYLMRTPLALYEKNQARLQAHVDRSVEAIKQGKTTGAEGKDFYIPKGSPIKLSSD